jgi:hypothetical protein
VSGGATVGSGRVYRLDPHTLPARSVPSCGGAAAATFIIEHDRAIVVRRFTPGAAVTVTVPLTRYAGVAVRMEPVGIDGGVLGTVALLHADPTLTLPLLVTEDPHLISADWQAWGRALDLPLLIIGQDGSIGEPLAGPQGIAMAPAKPRRRHSYFAQRRPRFLTRRKPGRPGAGERLVGREIIARS